MTLSVPTRRLLSLCLIGGACVQSPAIAAEQANSYPTAAVLGAVSDACSDLSNRDAAAAKVAASGWTKAANPSATPVGPLVDMGYAAGRKLLDEQGGKVDDGPLVYSRTVAGETLYLVLSSVTAQGSAVVGCRGYDVGETRRIGKDEASKWAGRAPDDAVERAELTKYTWEPGLKPGQSSFEIFYVPAGSPLIAMVKISGIAIKADRVSALPR